MSSLCVAAMPLCALIVAVLANFFSVSQLIFGFGILSILIALAFRHMKPLREL